MKKEYDWGWIEAWDGTQDTYRVFDINNIHIGTIWRVFNGRGKIFLPTMNAYTPAQLRDIAQFIERL